MSRETRQSLARMGGDALYAWRVKADLTQEQAAPMFGVTRQTYSKWESASKPPEMARWWGIHEATNGEVPWTVWAGQELSAIIRRLAASPAPVVQDGSNAGETTCT